MTTERKAIHYGWHIVWTGTFCLFACLGLARFALGMILPGMGRSLHLSYSQMGLISTVNLTGYLVAVLFCGSLADRFGYRRLIVTALAATGLTMILIGRTSSFAMILFCYTITGMGSGAANVPMMGLVSQWFARSHRGKAMGFWEKRLYHACFFLPPLPCTSTFFSVDRLPRKMRCFLKFP